MGTACVTVGCFVAAGTVGVKLGAAVATGVLVLLGCTATTGTVGDASLARAVGCGEGEGGTGVGLSGDSDGVADAGAGVALAGCSTARVG